MPPARAIPAAWPAILAVAAALLPLLLGLGGYPLMDPDEGRPGAIAQEMLARRDPVLLTLNGVSYFEKPPLLYWLTAASIRLLGPTELAVRLVPALAALCGLAIAWRLARSLDAPPLWSAAVLGTSLGVFAVARVPIVDMCFAACLAGALCAWLVGCEARGWRRFVPFGALLGLAILAKGPVAIVLTLGVLVGERLILALGRAPRAPFGTEALRLLGGLAIALLLAAPWFLAAQARDPRFAHTYFIVGHFQRYADSAQHNEPWWFYLAILPVLEAPWSLLWPAAARGVRSLPTRLAEPGLAFGIAWVAVVVGFFSLSECKLPQYILPACWPLALWSARALGRSERSPSRVGLLVAAHLLPLLGCLLLRQLVTHPPKATPPLEPPALLLLGAWIAAAVLCLLASRFEGDRRRALVVGAVGLGLLGLLPSYRLVAGSSDVGGLLPRELRRHDGAPGWTVAQYGGVQPSLGFYTGARVIGIDSPDLRGLGPGSPDGAEWFLEGEASLDALSARGPLALAAPARGAEELAARHGLILLRSSRSAAFLVNEAGLLELARQ